MAQQPDVVRAAAPAGSAGPLRRGPRASAATPQARCSCQPSATVLRGGCGGAWRAEEGAGGAGRGRGRRLGRGGHPGAPPLGLQSRGGFLVSVPVIGRRVSLPVRVLTLCLGAVQLSKKVINMGELRRLACLGVPDGGAGVRPIVWKVPTRIIISSIVQQFSFPCDGSFPFHCFGPRRFSVTLYRSLFTETPIVLLIVDVRCVFIRMLGSRLYCESSR